MVGVLDHPAGDRVDGDMFKAFGFDIPEYQDDPLDHGPLPPKLQIFEFCGLGEVNARCPKRAYIREEW